jgi:hypothetical protein
MYTHSYEYTYAHSTPMSTSEGLSVGISGDSQGHHWRLIIDGNVTYHLTYKSISKSLPNFTWRILCFANF